MTGLYRTAHMAHLYQNLIAFYVWATRIETATPTMPSWTHALTHQKSSCSVNVLCVLVFVICAMLIGQSQKYLAKYTWSRFRTSELKQAITFVTKIQLSRDFLKDDTIFQAATTIYFHSISLLQTIILVRLVADA